MTNCALISGVAVATSILRSVRLDGLHCRDLADEIWKEGWTDNHVNAQPGCPRRGESQVTLLRPEREGRGEDRPPAAIRTGLVDQSRGGLPSSPTLTPDWRRVGEQVELARTRPRPKHGSKG